MLRLWKVSGGTRSTVGSRVRASRPAGVQIPDLPLMEWLADWLTAPVPKTGEHRKVPWGFDSAPLRSWMRNPIG